MTKYLILNADDFGLSPSVNRGILAAYEKGTVSSTTLMTNMPGFEDAVARAKRTPELGVGLHFNLSYGRPLSPAANVSSLVQEDGVYSYHRGDEAVAWTAEDVQTELHAQWQRFVATGLRPTHVDSHHHVHTLAPAYAVVAAFCNAQGIPLRHTTPRPQSTCPHPPTTDKLIVDDYFHGDGKARLRAHIAALTDGVTEIMSHPGYVDDHVRAISSWTDVREVELAVFTDDEVARAIVDAGVVRTHFGKLAGLARREP